MFKVLSYNIHKGRAFFSRKKSWHILEDLLWHLKPDLVFLQEFFREPETEELLEKIADHLWPHHSYGKNAVSGDYHYGNAILSRFPIVQTKNYNISTSAYEKRGILYAQVQPPHLAPLNLFCTHLDLTDSGRRNQLSKIDKVIASICGQEEPLILAGDFNDWNNRLDHHFQNMALDDSLMVSKGYFVPTFPSVLPLFSLDKIYSRHFEILGGDRIFNQSLRYQSDHLPILTELAIKKM